MRREDFDHLYAEQRERVLALAFHMTGNRTLAEDVLQETFLLAWRHRGSFRSDALASTWIYRIAIRAAARARRRDRSRRTARIPDGLAGDLASPSDAATGAEEWHRLYQAMELLSEEHRVVLAMLTLREMTAEQIGLVLGIPANTVYSRAASARRRLRELCSTPPESPRPAC